jgi:importin subunit alpha-1
LNLDFPNVQINSLFALSYLTEGDDNQIDEVLSYGITPKIIKLLEANNTEIQTPALRTIGNLLTGDDSHAQVIRKKFV